MTDDRTQDFTARTANFDARTITADGRPPRAGSIDAFRRGKADRAIARIEERYRRGLTIPDVR